MPSPETAYQPVVPHPEDGPTLHPRRTQQRCPPTLEPAVTNTNQEPCENDQMASLQLDFSRCSSPTLRNLLETIKQPSKKLCRLRIALASNTRGAVRGNRTAVVGGVAHRDESEWKACKGIMVPTMCHQCRENAPETTPPNRRVCAQHRTMTSADSTGPSPNSTAPLGNRRNCSTLPPLAMEGESDSPRVLRNPTPAHNQGERGGKCGEASDARAPQGEREPGWGVWPFGCVCVE